MSIAFWSRWYHGSQDPSVEQPTSHWESEIFAHIQVALVELIKEFATVCYGSYASSGRVLGNDRHVPPACRRGTANHFSERSVSYRQLAASILELAYFTPGLNCYERRDMREPQGLASQTRSTAGNPLPVPPVGDVRKRGARSLWRQLSNSAALQVVTFQFAFEQQQLLPRLRQRSLFNMKGVISSLLLSATAIASATNCDVSLLTEIANSADASTCKSASNFVVPVESTVDTILTDLESFCDSDACQRVLDDLSDLEDCSIDGSSLLQSVVNPIGAVCSTTRALRAADGSHEHSSGMEMGSASTEMEDSHEATSSSMEDSHDTASASSGAEDSHDATSSTSASAEAGDEDSHDHTSSTATSSASTTSTTSSGSSTGSKATSNNSTSSTQAPSASSTSLASSISIAAGSIFLAAAAAFL